jgi:ABC-type bacteriocin/lantibiotic exporter with double-glycine peptidase domain
MLVTMTTGALVGIPAMLAQSSPSIRRVEEILTIPEPEPEPRELTPLRASASPPRVTVTNLFFQYPGMARPLLHDISFDIPAGACIGVIGGSGCGKSTLARILLGDLRPTSGQVMMDGIDVTDWHLWWKREVVGFLPAEQGFIRDTLEENVLFGRDREEVNDYETALAVSGVTAIASAKADQGGMQMVIDSRVDDFLSTGERRRVGIARLMLGRQRLWIFDEPGSGLDPRTMGEIARALSPRSRVLAGRTCMIITHDPDVFETSFNIFMLNGTVADIGPHAELLQRNAAYANLVGRYVKERAEHVAGPADLPAPLPAPAGFDPTSKRLLAPHEGSPR